MTKFLVGLVLGFIVGTYVGRPVPVKPNVPITLDPAKVRFIQAPVPNLGF